MDDFKSLVNQFNTVNFQVDTGLYSLKRVAFYLEKVSSLQKQYAIDLMKITEHEHLKNERTKDDKMIEHVDTYYKLQNVMSMNATNLLTFSEKITNEIVNPINTIYKDLEKRRLKAIENEAKYSSQLKSASEEIKIERTECLKQWKLLQDCMNDYEADELVSFEHQAKFEKSKKHLSKQRIKVARAFARFEISVGAANELQRALFGRDMPSLLLEMEAIETQRLDEMEKYCKAYCTLFRGNISPLDGMAASIENSVKLMNRKAAINNFVKSTLARCGPPTIPVQFSLGLPAQSSVIDSLLFENDLKIILYTDSPAVPRPSDTFSTNILSPVSETASAFSGFFGTNSILSGFLDSNVKIPTVPKVLSVKAPGSMSATGSKPPAPPVPTDNPPLLVVVALYDFSTDEPSDIKFNAGDLILVTMRPNNDEPNPQNTQEWWMGRVLYTGPPTADIITPDFDRAAAQLEINNKKDPTSLVATTAFDGSFPSNYVCVVKVDDSITLRHCLELKAGRHLLHNFLKSEYSQENIDFWLEVEQFRTLCIDNKCAFPDISDAPPIVMKTALDLCNKFIVSDADAMVNINSSHRTHIVDNIKNPLKVSAGFFDDAQQEIFKLLDSDSYARFKKSTFWQILINLKL